MNWVATILVAAMAATPGAAGRFSIASPESSQFVRLPFLPPCMRVALLEGDPRKGASVELARIAPSCVIPPHWHEANTRLIFVNGYGTHRVEGRKPATTALRAGYYVYLPAKQIHSFVCISGCLVYNLQDGPDVVHWVDSQGRDIPPARAFSHN